MKARKLVADLRETIQHGFQGLLTHFKDDILRRGVFSKLDRRILDLQRAKRRFVWRQVEGCFLMPKVETELQMVRRVQ